ncbi:hypothetical protein INT82_08015 [Mannheimia haemolytica]|nr:hypothetical protein [Mannheimia haemolytica]
MPFNGIYNKFLFYYLIPESRISEKSGGKWAPNISKEKIINYLFPLPPTTNNIALFKIEQLFAEIENCRSHHRFLWACWIRPTVTKLLIFLSYRLSTNLKGKPIWDPSI